MDEKPLYTDATNGPYAISITATDATPLPWEQSFGNTPKPPQNREQRRRAQRKRR